MPTPDRTSLEAIVLAGQEILESAGPAGLTMQAVAERVGVRAPSLYKRVDDREALLRLVADATISDLAERVQGSSLAQLAHETRAFAKERPVGFRLVFSSGASAEVLALASEPVLQACRDLVGDQLALDAARTVTAWANGFITMELSGAFQLGGDVDRAFEVGLELLTSALTEMGRRQGVAR